MFFSLWTGGAVMSFTSKTERRVIYSSGPHQHLIHTYIMAQILMGKKIFINLSPTLGYKLPEGRGRVFFMAVSHSHHRCKAE